MSGYLERDWRCDEAPTAVTTRGLPGAGACPTPRTSAAQAASSTEPRSAAGIEEVGLPGKRGDVNRRRIGRDARADRGDGGTAARTRGRRQPPRRFDDSEEDPEDPKDPSELNPPSGWEPEPATMKRVRPGSTRPRTPWRSRSRRTRSGPCRAGQSRARVRPPWEMHPPGSRPPGGGRTPLWTAAYARSRGLRPAIRPRTIRRITTMGGRRRRIDTEVLRGRVQAGHIHTHPLPASLAVADGSHATLDMAEHVMTSDDRARIHAARTRDDQSRSTVPA